MICLVFDFKTYILNPLYSQHALARLLFLIILVFSFPSHLIK